MPWDLRPTGVLALEVDVEAQPFEAEAERRERRWQNKPSERAMPTRARDEGALAQGGAQEKRIRFEESAAAPASASNAAETMQPTKRPEVQKNDSKDTEHVGQDRSETDNDHLDMFQHVYREWNQEADRLTHVAREKGATWNSYAMGR